MYTCAHVHTRGAIKGFGAPSICQPDKRREGEAGPGEVVEQFVHGHCMVGDRPGCVRMHSFFAPTHTRARACVRTGHAGSYARIRAQTYARTRTHGCMLDGHRYPRHSVCENYGVAMSGGCTGDNFYHWGALAGFMQILEGGYWSKHLGKHQRNQHSTKDQRGRTKTRTRTVKFGL